MLCLDKLPSHRTLMSGHLQEKPLSANLDNTYYQPKLAKNEASQTGKETMEPQNSGSRGTMSALSFCKTGHDMPLQSKMTKNSNLKALKNGKILSNSTLNVRKWQSKET